MFYLQNRSMSYSGWSRASPCWISSASFSPSTHPGGGGGGGIVFGEVGGHVEADAVRVEAGVVLVDGAAGLPEHRVPALLLGDGGVGLVVLGLPLHEHPPGLRLPVRYDRHIRIRRQRQELRRRRRHESSGPPHEIWMVKKSRVGLDSTATKSNSFNQG